MPRLCFTMRFGAWPCFAFAMRFVVTLCHCLALMCIHALCPGCAVLCCGRCIVPRLTVMLCHCLAQLGCSLLRIAIASQRCDVLCPDLPLPSPAPEASLRPCSALPCPDQMSRAVALLGISKPCSAIDAIRSAHLSFALALLRFSLPLRRETMPIHADADPSSTLLCSAFAQPGLSLLCLCFVMPPFAKPLPSLGALFDSPRAMLCPCSAFRRYASACSASAAPRSALL